MTRREVLVIPSACSLLGQAPGGRNRKISLFPLDKVEGAITPPDLFFVRDHFREPEFSLRTWRLKIEGGVKQPLNLSMSDILESPTQRIEAVLECAGNSTIGSAASNGVMGRRVARPYSRSIRSRARCRSSPARGRRFKPASVGFA